MVASCAGEQQSCSGEVESMVYTQFLEVEMGNKLTMVYWKNDRFLLGKLLEHSEIMTQGESVDELEENLKDAFRLMALEEVHPK